MPTTTAPTQPTILPRESLSSRVFARAAKRVRWEVEPGRATAAWAYHGTVPGPRIRLVTALIVEA